MRQLVLKIGKYFFFFIFFLALNLSCDEIDSQIPDVPVSLTINLNIYNELQNPGSSVYFQNVGFGGIIVSCFVEGEYYAYDAACTHEINQTCHLEPDGLLAVCPCCESQFSLFYAANPTKGPAAAPLKQYNISLLGNSTLRVYN
ncbi:Rieske 2Fe-2S domain-containing protein [uncultured Draconibacterium sp.]|uniref:Rieske (2Fe-2S) protein n=1 Tax=uncultured Draconibacterium sp. TaxID=1573823 RepID=UPI003217EA76